jgi:valyl-tRNA synthetase
MSLPNYLIDVPPPTISGSLHLGHVFSYCQMDIIARFHRMEGRELLYPSCYDCNGLPTEKLAQKEANIRDQQGIIEFAAEKWSMYQDLFEKTKMGWSDHHFHSFDDLAVQTALLSFEDLVAKGYAYKATRDYFYCPVTKVSVSQAEIDENGCYERSGAKVETRHGEGWYINMMDNIPRIRDAIDSINWEPIAFKHRLHRWLDELKFDWSISRERKFGIPIPGEEGIVFDTWFTSSLSPQMAWASQTKVASLDCPIFDVRFQAHDIIRTWALFTIVKSLYHNNRIPWKNIVISGHALDAKGHKISKSAGNFVPPQKYLDQYGSYGLRYWAAHNVTGTDTKTDIALMDKGKKLANKIRNANRFVQAAPSGDMRNDLMNEWFEVESQLHAAMGQFDWSTALAKLTSYFWDKFCSVHIEECKKSPMGTRLRILMKHILMWYEIFIPGISDELQDAERTPGVVQEPAPGGETNPG